MRWKMELNRRLAEKEPQGMRAQLAIPGMPISTDNWFLRNNPLRVQIKVWLALGQTQGQQRAERGISFATERPDRVRASISAVPLELALKDAAKHAQGATVVKTGVHYSVFPK